MYARICQKRCMCAGVFFKKIVVLIHGVSKKNIRDYFAYNSFVIYSISMKIGENVQKGSFYILIKPFDVRNVHRVLQRTREVEIPTFPPTRRLCAVLARSKLIGFAVLAHPHCSFCFCTPSLAFSS